jgi:hypothetical protein
MITRRMERKTLLKMNSLVVRSHRSLLERLAQRRLYAQKRPNQQTQFIEQKQNGRDTYVSMTSPRNIFCTRTIFHCQHRTGDHLASVRPDDMHTQHAIRVCFDEELNEALRVEVRLGATVCKEGEFSDLVFRTLRFEVGFRRSDPGHFGVCVYDRGDSAVVDVTVPGFEVLCDSDAYRK